MFVGGAPVPQNIAVGCFDPAVLGHYLSEYLRPQPNPKDTKELRVFIDSTREDTGLGPEIKVSAQGYVLVAKDKRTMLAGLRAIDGGTLKSESGTLVIAQGSYSGELATRAKLAVLTMAPFGSFLHANSKMVERKAQNKFYQWANPREAKNQYMRLSLHNRGYFIFAIGRTAFNTPPPKTALTYVGDYATSFKKLATLASHGKDV